MHYYLICASKDPIIQGMKNGSSQAGHGWKNYVDKLQKGDWIGFG
jgi:hypothetical protein